MYKFTGWMLPTGALFDRYAVRDWSGAQVQTSKYFLGLAAGTRGHVVGVLEVAPNQLLLVVEWDSTDATARQKPFPQRPHQQRRQAVFDALAA